MKEDREEERQMRCNNIHTRTGYIATHTHYIAVNHSRDAGYRHS